MMITAAGLLLMFMLFLTDKAHGFSSRHLILQGCSAQSQAPSAYWLGMKHGLVEGLAAVGLPFDTVICPLNKIEEREAVESMIQQWSSLATISNPILIVAALVQPGHCEVGDDLASACPGVSDQFDTYSVSLYPTTLIPVIHIWIEVSPNATQYNLSRDGVVASLQVSPDNFAGGRKAGFEYCHRMERHMPQRIAAFYGEASAQHSFERIAGFQSALSDHCPQHRIVRYAHADWSFATARVMASSLFLSDGDIGSVVCANDAMALGVIEAARETLSSGANRLVIVGYDNSPPIQEPLFAGLVSVTVDQLTSGPNEGLIFKVRTSIIKMHELIQDSSSVLSTSRLMQHFGLTEAKISSSVLPVVTNRQEYIKRSLMKSYDPLVRPFSNLVSTSGSCGQYSSPTTVETQFQIVSLQSVSESDGTYIIEGYLRLWWNDTRLRFTGLDTALCVDKIPFAPSQIWLPDIYFDGVVNWNSIFAVGSPQPSGYQIEVDSSGLVSWSRLAKLEVKCPFDFRRLPFDTQSCPYTIGTYSQDSTQVMMQWRTGEEPMPGWSSASRPPWELLSVDQIRNEDAAVIQANTWTYAMSVLRFKRDSTTRGSDIEYAVICVGLAYLGYWVPEWDPLALQVVVMLILVTHRQSVEAQMPPGCGRTWLQDFLQGCFAFCLIAFVSKAVEALPHLCDVKIATLNRTLTRRLPQSEVGQTARAATRELREVASNLDSTFRFVYLVSFLLFLSCMFSGLDDFIPSAYLLVILTFALATVFWLAGRQVMAIICPSWTKAPGKSRRSRAVDENDDDTAPSPRAPQDDTVDENDDDTVDENMNDTASYKYTRSFVASGSAGAGTSPSLGSHNA